MRPKARMTNEEALIVAICRVWAWVEGDHNPVRARVLRRTSAWGLRTMNLVAIASSLLRPETLQIPPNI
jgi:hypothetical protein